MHDPDGPTPKPPSTWGNAAGVALHNVYYRTTAGCTPPGGCSGPTVCPSLEVYAPLWTVCAGRSPVRMPWPYVPGVCAGMRTGEHLTAYTGRIQRRRVKRISAAAALAIGDQFDMVAACRRPGMAIASW